MKTGAVRVLSFDLDNTLYDNSPVIKAAEEASQAYLREAFLAQGQVYQRQQWQTLRQQLLNEDPHKYEDLTLLRRACLQRLCESLERADDIIETAFDLFVRARNQIVIPAPIGKLIAFLATRFVLVSLTNGNVNAKSLSVNRFFKAHYSPAMGLRAKPDGQMLKQLLVDFELQPEQLIHIGDLDDSDGAAAKDAKVTWLRFAPFAAVPRNEDAKSENPPLQAECDQLLARILKRASLT